MLLSFQTWKERHPLTRSMSPVATGSGGPSGREDSPVTISAGAKRLAGIPEYFITCS
jgi:hypothetical protein